MEFDPGPPPSIAEVLARVLDYSEHRDDFWLDWGPIFYRGRLDGSARLLCVASDPGATERIAGRTLVGDAGQRVQGFLTRLGLTRSYLCLNAFVYGMHPSHFFEAPEILNEQAQTDWRNELFDKSTHITSTLQAVVAFGANAKIAVDLWDGKRDIPVFDVHHPSFPDEDVLLSDWRSRDDAAPRDRHARRRRRQLGTELRLLLRGGGLLSDPPVGPALRRPVVPRRRLLAPDRPPATQYVRRAAGRRSRPHADLARPGHLGRLTVAGHPPVDPRTEAYGLEGHVVTMDEHFTELERGVVYLRAGEIGAVAPTDAPPPPGFEQAPVIATGGTIFPGLIELHNHLTYDVLPLWNVPQRFPNRDKWSAGAMQATYRKNISGPMTVLGRTPGLIEAVVRYVEAKCLLGGVTTSQGIALFSNQGAQAFFHGVVRNVESSTIPGMPPALTRIGDVEATDVAAFLHRLESSTCLLLHLSEGTDVAAHEHFEALHIADDEWAITPALAGIHSVALEGADFDVVAERGGSMVWSPFSNLLLYGDTAKIGLARSAGVTIGLGSDWSPSGSKNLLGELKVARLFDAGRDVFAHDRDLVATATRDAARVLHWDTKAGSLEPGKRADLLVLTGRAGDAYERLLGARETSIRMVAIDGVPRCGAVELMGEFDLGPGTERITVGDSERVLNLADPQANPIIEALSLAEATDRLQEAMSELPELAKGLESPSASLSAALASGSETRWMLLLDHEEPAGLDQRPHLPGPDGLPTAELPLDLALASTPLSELLEPIALDPLTVSDDGTFLGRVAEEMNLPDGIKQGLPALY